MILYVNGDSHSVGHGIANSAGMADDDCRFEYIEESPHPENFLHTWGYKLAELLDVPLVCQARSGGSLDRCIRTTRNFVYQTNKKVFVIISVPSFERIEKKYLNHWYQFNIGDHTRYPEKLHQPFKSWLSSLNGDYTQYYEPILKKLYNFHLELNKLNIPHYFFNAEQIIKNSNGFSFDECYDSEFCYRHWCLEKNYKPDEWSHFNQDAHCSFAKDFLLDKIQL